MALKIHWTASELMAVGKLRREVRTLAEVEQRYVLRALASHDWNYTRTAEALGVCLRTLKNWVHEWKVHGAIAQLKQTVPKGQRNRRRRVPAPGSS